MVMVLCGELPYIFLISVEIYILTEGFIVYKKPKTVNVIDGKGKLSLQVGTNSIEMGVLSMRVN